MDFGRQAWKDRLEDRTRRNRPGRRRDPLPRPGSGKSGDSGHRLWWCCPFHADRNPSFVIEPGRPTWHCYGCGAHGDAATLVMKLKGATFPEAVSLLARPRNSLGNHEAPPELARPPNICCNLQTWSEAP